MATTSSAPSAISGGSFLLETRPPEDIFTPEDFSEQHVLIAQTAEQFAIKEIVPNIEKMEHKDFSVTRDLLKKAGELGLSSAEIPEAYGGRGVGKETPAGNDCQPAEEGRLRTTWGGQNRGGAIPLVC